MADDRLHNATRVHVCTTGSRSGISHYAQDFHRLVLEPEGYVLADPVAVLQARGLFAPDTRFHVQLGIFQHRERLAMSQLMELGYHQIEATLHDPPFLTFPYFQFSSGLLMRLSRGFDWYLDSLGVQRRALERLSCVFVLSQAGQRAVLRRAPKAQVIAIPHVVATDRIWGEGRPLGKALLYFGFIGPGKGLEYALQLHRRLLQIRPETHLHVVGQASGASGQRYLARLQAEYSTDVTFHGFVSDDELDSLFERAAHVVLPYAEYRYVRPASGSLIQALRRARIVWTTDVNATSELIADGKNGFMLTGDIDVDAARFADVLKDEAFARRISDGARQTAVAIAQYPYRNHFAGNQ